MNYFVSLQTDICGMNELRQTVLLKQLSLDILLSFYNHYYLFIHLPVHMCVPCVEVATPPSLFLLTAIS